MREAEAYQSTFFLVSLCIVITEKRTKIVLSDNDVYEPSYVHSPCTNYKKLYRNFYMCIWKKIMFKHFDVEWPVKVCALTGLSRAPAPWFRAANVCPLLKIQFCRRKQKFYSHLKNALIRFRYCFHICDTKSTYEDTAVQPAQCVLLFNFFRLNSRAPLFVLTKHVNALSVLEENAIDFAWEICWILAGYFFSI